MDVVRLGILGGTFDPIHNGHLKLAKTVYTALNLKQVLFVPAGDPPHKQNHFITPAHHRLQMVQLAIKAYPHYQVSSVDLDRPGPHYSVDMLQHLQAQHHLSADNCFFIIGADSLIDLPKWHKPHRLLTLCRLAVIARPSYTPNLSYLNSVLPNLAARLNWVQMSPIPISATMLRNQLRQGEGVADYVPEAVLGYIKAKKLF